MENVSQVHLEVKLLLLKHAIKPFTTLITNRKIKSNIFYTWYDNKLDSMQAVNFLDNEQSKYQKRNNRLSKQSYCENCCYKQFQRKLTIKRYLLFTISILVYNIDKNVEKRIIWLKLFSIKYNVYLESYIQSNQNQVIKPTTLRQE